ncbi:hypothetical protein C1M55_31410 (plasmid) [Rhodococcus qingshengii]|jgi:hypothetical protein|uniref:hypothetical protein n=1 Tax=Rhodococcus qingshengii TaxID=334542 RepID=UPI000C9FF219|nr:hypothetical protein [Rhodococcus qingshengii]AUS35766.1 hypothetical protein C1M55_31410 [Rhodococcus qingshengii]
MSTRNSVIIIPRTLVPRSANTMRPCVCTDDCPDPCTANSHRAVWELRVRAAQQKLWDEREIVLTDKDKARAYDDADHALCKEAVRVASAGRNALFEDTVDRIARRHARRYTGEITATDWTTYLGQAAVAVIAAIASWRLLGAITPDPDVAASAQVLRAWTRITEAVAVFAACASGLLIVGAALLAKHRRTSRAWRRDLLVGISNAVAVPAVLFVTVAVTGVIISSVVFRS